VSTLSVFLAVWRRGVGHVTPALQQSGREEFSLGG